MISGSQTLSSIERAILDLRSEENRLAGALQSATDEAVRLRAAKADHFKALAEMELDALKRQQVVNELDTAERRALELLEKRNQRLTQETTQKTQAEEKARAAEAEHAKAAEATEALNRQIEELTQRVGATARTTPEWSELQKQIAHIETVAKGAEEKTRRAEADRDSKRKPYESDSLFLYLWKAGYGTSKYRGGAIRRFFDAKVAKLVDFDSARLNYQMLTDIPLRLREHADRLEEERKARIAQQGTMERQTLEANGIASLEQQLAAAQKSLKEAEARMTQANGALTAFDKRPANGAQEDPEYTQAIGVLAERLGREDLNTLYQRALATPSPSDDRIVQLLRDNDQAVARAEGQVQQIRGSLAQLAAKRAELEQSRSRFYQAGYNNPMGGFVNGALIGTVLGGILNGSRSSGGLDDIFADGWRQRPRFPGGFGGGNWGGDSGSSWGGDSGGSWGGGGGDGGSFGGDDGFTTGGGF
jgi:hypothetical protein